MLSNVCCLCVICLQLQYKQASRTDGSTSLYHLMPETNEMHFAKEQSEQQSEVSGAAAD